MKQVFLRKALTVIAGAMVVLSSAAFAQTIKIGMITDKVGPAKGYAEPVAQGAVYAVKELNAKGGLLGRQIELLVEDDQGKPDVSATAARKLVDSGRGIYFVSVADTCHAAGAVCHT